MVVDGWSLFAHPHFGDQLDRLMKAVELERAKAPGTTTATPNAKLLATLRTLVFETIPADPTRPDFRQGGTLGAGRTHWFRAKFGGQRFRLFFRFDTRSRIIVYAWVNDGTTLRAYGARTDAYAVFRRMLAAGNPPDAWSDLLAEASDAGALARLSRGPPPGGPDRA